MQPCPAVKVLFMLLGVPMNLEISEVQAVFTA